ncbi:MAG: hypothetical protein WA432_01320 [Candidatus Babeliaceae bacterium]
MRVDLIKYGWYISLLSVNILNSTGFILITSTTPTNPPVQFHHEKVFEELFNRLDQAQDRYDYNDVNPICITPPF